MVAPRPHTPCTGLAGVPFAHRRRFERGNFIVEAGSPAEVVYLVRSGHVRCFLLESDGRETTTAILGRGQLVGLAPLVGRASHSEFAQALTDVDIWALPTDDMRTALANNPALLGLTLGCVAQRLAVTIALLKAVSLLPAAERIRDAELRLPLLAGNLHEVKRRTLAGLLQVRPETLARNRMACAPAGASCQPASQASIGVGQWTFCPNDAVLDVDLAPECVGIVESGQLQLYLTNAQNGSVLVDRLEAADLFGIGALFGLPPVRLRLVGLSAGSVEILSKSQLLNRLVEDSSKCQMMLTRLATRVERMECRLAQASHADVRQRIIDLLRQAAVDADVRGRTSPHVAAGGWSHISIARRLGVCRETVTRGLAVLAESGAIRRDGRRILLASQNEVTARPHRSAPRAAETTRHRVSQPASTHPRENRCCRLCGLRTVGLVCEGCADRLELELQHNGAHACAKCGRHRELCQVLPCGDANPPDVDKAERIGVVWLPATAAGGMHEVPCISRIADEDRA